MSRPLSFGLVSSVSQLPGILKNILEETKKEET
jgi:hypothetical protein